MIEGLICVGLLILTFSTIGFALFLAGTDRITIYPIIWEIEHLNTLGKIILCVLITPFSLPASIIVLLAYLAMAACYYIAYGFRLLFATDREAVRQKYKE